ncbi:unnamed protein product [Prorocentrum cordatum]|uniref:Uncharacterized protein n=1 Tax=Prorocentrum cordatum TaxID=2364126 RepID=A0ABN9QBN8_9DINO|nr:unnamed protein product [Polarella glacialis]
MSLQSFFGMCRMSCVSQSVATSSSIVQDGIFRTETFANNGSVMRDSFSGTGLCANGMQDVIVGMGMKGRLTQSIPASALIVPADTPPVVDSSMWLGVARCMMGCGRHSWHRNSTSIVMRRDSTAHKLIGQTSESQTAASELAQIGATKVRRSRDSPGIGTAIEHFPKARRGSTIRTSGSVLDVRLLRQHRREQKDVLREQTVRHTRQRRRELARHQRQHHHVKRKPRMAGRSPRTRETRTRGRTTRRNSG